MGAGECIFCKMVAGEIPVTKVFEDEVSLAFLDINPVSEGHTLVIPKDHSERLDESTPEDFGVFASRLGRIAGAVKGAMDADGYNLLCNNGRAAGQLIGHLHFHIIPRRTGDGVFDRWPSFEYGKGRIDEIAEAIRSFF